MVISPSPKRQAAPQSKIQALFTDECPLQAESPYHAFAPCPPTALFGKPQLWPGPESPCTTARLLWNKVALYVLWECEGKTHAPVSRDAVEPSVLETIEVQPDQRTILLDERVEVFLWQPMPGDVPSAGQSYFAFEMNFAGKSLTNKASFGADGPSSRGAFDFSWGGKSAYSSWTDELAVGWAASASPIPGESSHGPVVKRVVIGEFKWEHMDIDISRGLRIGLHRASYPEGGGMRDSKALTQADVGRIQGEFVWSSWVDPGDSVVNFHREDCFGHLELLAKGSKTDHSCSAARLVAPKKLRVLRSPLPSLDECPAGSVLVQAKYTSVCGSDMPYFKSDKLFPNSCYWDRDGFCGHEVVGVVVGSKSDQFQLGDPVLALPSSYFKAHAGSKQEWYREEVHGVLLQDFPVRGAFSQFYTSHELYCYKLKSCVPEMLAAQGLGTVLRLARKLGPVLGKTVVVVGLGQNGLIVTRLMSQFCAGTLIAVDPLEYRRKLGLDFGADVVVGPSEALNVITTATGGRGADVVIEMVGHNQDSINQCLDYVKCTGIVAAFGVPDDPVYDHFHYAKMFRKNVNMISSVIPDPGLDFPQAVRLIEQGRFSTKGIFTHNVPLRDVSKGIEIASSYTENVVKLVVEMDVDD